MTTFASALSQRAATLGQPALVPTITLGDPDFATCGALMEALAEQNAPALDLHLPFSDPCADSVALQSASHRALHQGLKIKAALALIASFKAKYPNMPLMLSLYVNNALAYGLERFLQEASAAGINAVLFTDVSHSMVACAQGPFNFKELSAKFGLELVLLAPDNQSPAALHAIFEDAALSLVLPIQGARATATALVLARQHERVSVVPMASGVVSELALMPAGCTALTTGDMVANCVERGGNVVSAVITQYQALCTAALSAARKEAA